MELTEIEWRWQYGQALMEFMEQYLRLRIEERFEEGLKKGIQGMVKILRNLGHSDCEIKEIIKKIMAFQKKRPWNIYERLPEQEGLEDLK